MDNSICNFIPYKNDYNSLHTVNFVFETKKQIYSGISSQSVYRVYCVSEGKGLLHLANKKQELEAGDIFFSFPGTPFSIEYIDNFKYMYITFLGTRANMIMDKLNITHNNFHFPGYEDVLSFWKNNINVNAEISDLIAESVLLYTFYSIGNKTISTDNEYKESEILPLNIKKYVDDNYSNVSLNLNTISENLKYSPKYLSSVFKKNFNITLTDYITTLRIQHACTLISHGFTSISDISNQCGYNDSQYFSKVFKKIIKKTPSEYIKNPNT